MSIRFSELSKRKVIDKVIIHSLHTSLFQVSVVVGSHEAFVVDDAGKMLRGANIISLQKLFRSLNYRAMVLRHQSAYDEMIGQPENSGTSNTLEVPLVDHRLDLSR